MKKDALRRPQVKRNYCRFKARPAFLCFVFGVCLLYNRTLNRFNLSSIMWEGTNCLMVSTISFSSFSLAKSFLTTREISLVASGSQSGLMLLRCRSFRSSDRLSGTMLHPPMASIVLIKVVKLPPW